MFLGLACEGVSDHAVIENILEGLIDSIDETEVKRLQPHLDETSKKQTNYGGWTTLFEYLNTDRFEEDLINCSNLIVHFDSDISEHPNFNVPHCDLNNVPLDTETLVENIKNRIIQKIDSRRAGLYQTHGGKIIFCISVHSMECWLLPFFTSKNKPHKTINCERALLHELREKKFEKNYQFYEKLSQPLKNAGNLKTLRARDPSFEIFCTQLEKIQQ